MRKEKGKVTYMLAPEMVTPVEDPTSKASVLCPRESPAELSMVIPETVRVVQLLIDMSCTGEFSNLRLEMVDVVNEWA
jgi:hypothetical protein